MDSPVLLLVFCSLLAWSRGQQEITEKSGSDVTFTALQVIGSPTEINWSKDGVKIVDLEVGRPPYFYNREDKVIADLEKKTLILKNVIVADSGVYTAQPVYDGRYNDSVIFRLQVLDPIGPVVINTTTVENNVTLRCITSRAGAPPSKYEWFDGTRKSVSMDQNITVQKVNTEQSYQCMASNAVSNNSSTITVPARTDNWRLHYILIAVFSVIFIFITAIIIYLLWKRKRSKEKRETEQENQKMDPRPIREPSVDRPINPMSPQGPASPKDVEPKINQVSPQGDKDIEIREYDEGDQEETPLMTPVPPKPSRLPQYKDGDQKLIQMSPQEFSSHCVTLNLKFPPEKRYVMIWKKCNNDSTQQESESIQPGTLQITSVQDGEYEAEVTGTTKYQDRFILLTVRDQVLNMQNVDRIMCHRDGAEPRSVVCRPDPLLKRLKLHEGSVSAELLSGDTGTYVLDVCDSALCYMFSVQVLDLPSMSGVNIKRSVKIYGSDLELGDITLCPVYFGNPRNITWRKDDKTLAQWAEGADPADCISDKYILDPRSGNLTIKNVEEEQHISSAQSGVTYIMEAEGDEKTVQELILDIRIMRDL